jgi:TPP-dependent pyruvate/acetoin dehydrogenase alpha subunit
MSLPRSTAVDVLRRMLLIRRFEEAVIRMTEAHKEVGRNHLSIGHEAVAAPAMALLRNGDLVHTTHRNHGVIIARGVDPGRALAEIMARAGGLSGGKGGTFHLCDRATGFQPTSAIVGGSVGLAVGSALALKKTGRGNVSVAQFGDGVLDEGIAFEALNFVALFQLPVLLLCENNSVPGELVQSSKLAAREVADVPAMFGIPVERVDGADAAAVYAVVERAIERVRATGGPVYVEAALTRWPGTYSIEPGYPTGLTDLTPCWTGAEIVHPHADWIANADPVLRFVRALLADEVTPDEITSLDRTVQHEIDEAVRFAEASPFPGPEAAVTAVFA